MDAATRNGGTVRRHARAVNRPAAGLEAVIDENSRGCPWENGDGGGVLLPDAPAPVFHRYTRFKPCPNALSRLCYHATMRTAATKTGGV